ncbi:hypothetical protein BDV96DRAFT_585411 [Lophiotrema nucula]|uniref:RRM domain-containing protein n=1 Tax=Lophiotrema nucula TaxID=690887 RepID=A0A6A5YQG1_9PLEO|nr:hypothetical protein BDV96DRAFT_585411 [Lophiotrema nucula]
MNGDGYSREGGRHGGSRSYSSRDDRRDRGDRGDRGDRDRGHRRRSRSPRGGGGSRRQDYEVDTYSSSRDYREREREDTYARRERRGGDRDWGDSYSRRDGPRRDDDRGYGGRRDRDDDRGGRGRRDRGDRGDRDGGFGGGRERKKSASPPFKKREATPDLTPFENIQKRQRRLTQWDIKPQGYENITAEQAKLSGMFPLPGAPRAAPMDPTKLAAFMNPTSGSGAEAKALKPGQARQAKRLFIYNLPGSATPESVKEFFNLQLNGLNVVSGIDPCVEAHMSDKGGSALLEFRAPEDATMALAFNGITMDENAMDESTGPDRSGLSIRRPNDYIVPTAEDENYVEGVIGKQVPDSPNKLCIVNIPELVDEESLQSLLIEFGQLKSFVLVKENNAEVSRGIAFCEYVDSSIIDAVIDGLNTIQLSDQFLKVTRASIGLQQAAAHDGGVGAMTMLAGGAATEEQEKTRVVVLLNMVTPDELLDQDTYEDIKEDVEEECSKFGKIVEVKIPRPSGIRSSAGVGKIYVKYDVVEGAQKAIKALAGRKFDSRTVVASQFSEELFDTNAW